MAEIKWVTTIATSTAIAESVWKREIENASILFKWWRKQYHQDRELDWMYYNGIQGIRSWTAKHMWDRNRALRTTEKTGTPYEQSLKKTTKKKDTRKKGHLISPE